VVLFCRASRDARDAYPCLQGALVFAVFLAAAIGAVGLPALAAPGSVVLGEGPDVQIFIWGLRWWPEALGHGFDPFTAHLLWPPAGVSTLWTTTVPALALLAAPVTLTAGPIVAWNALVVLAPAIAAWATYLLARELRMRLGWAMLAGALFGLSGYEQSQGLAHLQLTACAVVPLTVRLLARFAHGQVGRTGVVVRIAALVALQALISVEVLISMIVVGALTAAGRWLLCPARRSQTTLLAQVFALGLLASLPVTAVIAAVMLSTAPAHDLNPTQNYSLDLLNVIVPTHRALLGGAWTMNISRQFTGNLAEQDGYLGIPLIVLFTLGLWARRTHTFEQTAGCALLASLLLSFGALLHIAGHSAIPLPSAVLSDVPLLNDLIPDRFALYTALVSAILAARQLQHCRLAFGYRTVLTTALLFAPLAPAASQPAPSAAIARLIPNGSTTISLPFWDQNDRAIELQAQARSHFALIDRWIQDTPASDRPLAHIQALYGRDVPTRSGALTKTLCRDHITTAVIWPGHGSQPIAHALDVRPPTGPAPTITNLHCRPPT
jgi:hypothetical protein